MEVLLLLLSPPGQMLLIMIVVSLSLEPKKEKPVYQEKSENISSFSKARLYGNEYKRNLRSGEKQTTGFIGVFLVLLFIGMETLSAIFIGGMVGLYIGKLFVWLITF